MDVNLSDYKNKYVVLFFYPLDFTFVCPTEILEFSNQASKFRYFYILILDKITVKLLDAQLIQTSPMNNGVKFQETKEV